MLGRLRSHSSFALLAVVLAAGCSSGDGSSGAKPVLTDLTPASGTVGTVVTIAGSSFEQSGSASTPVYPIVTFAAAGQKFTAPVTSFSPTAIEVAVPAVAVQLAADGTPFDVTVANPGGRSTTLPGAFRMSLPAIVAVNGGLAGSGTAGSLFIVDGRGFGDLAAPPAAGYAYSVDFRDPGSGAVIATAAIDFAVGNWQDIFIVGTVPPTLPAAATPYQLTVTTPSGTSAPARFLVVPTVSFSPSTITWSAASALPVAQQGFPTVLAPVGATTFAYALGGNTGTDGTAQARAQNLDTVWFAPVDATTGAVGAWTATTPLPQKRGFATAVAANAFNSLVPGNGNLYVLGGLDATGQATDSVYFVSLAADGTVPPPPDPTATAAGGVPPPPSWTAAAPLPQPLFAASAMLFHGRIYVAGGNDATGAPVATVYSARILADGTLEPWVTLPSLPAPVAYHQLLTSAGVLYVVGGDGAAVDPTTRTAAASEQAAISYAPLQIRTGALSAWNVNANTLTKAREKFTAVVAGSNLVVTGGLYSGLGHSASENAYATIGTDGTVSAFQGATGSNTIESLSGTILFNHSGAYFVDTAGMPHILVLGGQDATTGTLLAGVWFQH